MSGETMGGRWRHHWSDGRFRALLAVTMVFVVAAVASLAAYLSYNETRPGAIVDDPILAWFRPRDVSVVVFLLMYTSLVAAVTHVGMYPRQLVTALQAYALMACFRMAVMYTLPLEPPPSMIILKDPLVAFVETGTDLTKDLFFSGHTATMFLFYLTSPSPLMRRVYLSGTVVVGGLVLWQHAHYTVDVLAAPFFAFGAYRLARLLTARALDRTCASSP